MTTPLQLSEDSRLIQSRALRLFNELKELEDAGAIKTQTGKLHQFYNRIRLFYESIGRPLFTVREADYLPSSQDHNQMMKEILQDLELLYEEAGRIRDGLERNFKDSEADRGRVERRLQRAEDRSKGLLKRAEAEENSVILHEGFTDRMAMDEEMTANTPARIWTREGVLTLAPSSATDLTAKGLVEIEDGNGLPGNTKEAGSVDGAVRFIGEDALHIDAAALLDSNPDTWLEYEHFHVDRDTMNAAGRFGFSYQEGMAWADYQTEALELKVRYSLLAARSINWLSVTPFISDSRGAKTYTLESIEVLDGKGGVFRPLNEPVEMDNEKVFLFGQKLCSEVLFIFKQVNAYPTEVGHFYFEENEQTETNYLDRMKAGRAERLKAPLPSIQSLNLSYDPDNKQILYPAGHQGSVIEEIDKKKEALFTEPVVPEAEQGQVRAGTELISAKRFLIGVRDIGVASYQFEQESEYVSLPHKPGGEIIGVSLTAESEVPDLFPEGDWIKYSISPDNGETWYVIDPRDTTRDGAKLMYLFNTNTPNEGRIPQFGYADIGQPVESLLLKIEMSRPANIPSAPSYTPVVKGYGLHIVRKGGLKA